MSPRRVLIVDDDPVFRHVLSLALGMLPGVELAGLAQNLTVARSKIDMGGIDVVLIDVVLREESGLDLLTWIQAHHPHLITVLLTAGTSKAASQTIDALLLGASSLVLKPTGPDATHRLIEALSSAVSAPTPVNPPQATTTKTTPSTTQELPMPMPMRMSTPCEMLVLGASTGGPRVLLQFLQELPASFTVPIAIVQHMPAPHVPHFADLLCKQSGRRVVVARDGEVVERGGVYLAGNARHLVVERKDGQLILRQQDTAEEHNCRPAVDPLFYSAARVVGAATVAVIFTGMGADGARGARALHDAGARVAAQDKQTSVVWGMPGAVVAAGAADVVLPISELAACVTRWCATPSIFDARERALHVLS